MGRPALNCANAWGAGPGGNDREDPVWLQHPIRPESEFAQQRERPLVVRGVGDDGIHAAQPCERPLEWTVVELDAKVRGRRREGGALPPR